MLLSVLLEELGFTILQAENGSEALEIALEHLPEIVITDLLMPVMDGIELTKQLRKSAIKDVIIIMNSASVFEQDQRESLAAGCNAFVAKPINTQFLLGLLQKYLKLEWIYEESEEKTESSDLVLPSAEQAAALLRLVIMGDVVRITENVTELEQQNPALGRFAKKVKQLAKGFRIAKIEELIKLHFQNEQLKIAGYSDH
jgi:CheY-like chemotaxis protein